MNAGPERTRNVVIFYNEAGGGHRAAAQAIEAVLQERGHRVTLVNPVQDLFGPYDWFSRWTPGNMEVFYNRVVLARSWGVVGTTLYFLFASLNLWVHGRKVVDGGRRLYAELQPDAVISVLSGVNHLFAASVRPNEPGPALVFVNTDFQETFPWSWFPRTGNYYAITGTERSYQQALRTVGRPERVFRTSGMPVRPSFYTSRVADVTAERVRLGLDPDRLTVAVLYGGSGCDRMLEIAAWLAEADAQAIFLCGNNPALIARLGAMKLPYPNLVVPYTKDVQAYFDLADAVVGKAGPGCISEALVRKRPVLVDRGSVMPQERYNARWVVASGVGIDFVSKATFLKAVAVLHSADGRARLAAQAERHENRAIFEIPEIVEGILTNRTSHSTEDRMSHVR